MSPHAVNDLASSFVEMAKAYEELPKVMEALEIERQMNDDRGKHIQALELKAHQRNVEIETLHSTIRSLEVARDDAELRFLELDEHATAVTRSLGDMQAALGQAVALLNPPKPQPEPEPINPYAQEPLPISPALHEDAGQSEPDPTPVAIEREGSTGSVSETVTSTGTVSIQPEPTLYGPYYGLRYINVPGYISRKDWLAGGGTEYDYDWRLGQDYLPF